jgi:hypothetical protein
MFIIVCSRVAGMESLGQWWLRDKRLKTWPCSYPIIDRLIGLLTGCKTALFDHPGENA